MRWSRRRPGVFSPRARLGGGRRWLAASWAAAGLLVALALAGCGSPSAPTSSGAADTGVLVRTETAEAARPLAERLAEVQRGRPVAPEARLVKRIRRHLLALDRSCVEKRMRIAELVIGARVRLAEAGIRRSIPEILEALNASIPRESVRVDCAALVATYVDFENATGR